MKKLLLAVLVLFGLQTQAQQSAAPYFCCDSITYWTDQSQGFNIGLDTSNIVHNPDSMEVWWGVCTHPNGVCYAGQGMYYYFPQVTVYDTIKVTYELPSSCYEFHSLYYQYKETTRIVAIRSLEILGENCPQVVIEKELEIPITVSQKEDYLFKFWKGKDNNGEDIFEEKVVPVN